MLSNKAYDIIKWVAVIFLPALAAFYYAIGQVWGVQNTEQVVGTIVSFDAFLGALIGVSTMRYNATGAKFDGTMDVIESDKKTTYSLNLTTEPEVMREQKSVTFKVAPSSEA